MGSLLPGVVFPVSAAILDRIDEYRKVLEDYSKRLLPLIEWQPTEDGNVRVLNDTADFYRFFDATPHAEFFYSCVQKTIDEDLPQEAEFLARYDRFRARVEAMVDMPERTVGCFFASCTRTVGRYPSVRAKRNSLASPSRKLPTRKRHTGKHSSQPKCRPGRQPS